MTRALPSAIGHCKYAEAGHGRGFGAALGAWRHQRDAGPARGQVCGTSCPTKLLGLAPLVHVAGQQHPLTGLSAGFDVSEYWVLIDFLLTPAWRDGAARSTWLLGPADPHPRPGPAQQRGHAAGTVTACPPFPRWAVRHHGSHWHCQCCCGSPRMMLSVGSMELTARASPLDRGRVDRADACSHQHQTVSTNQGGECNSTCIHLGACTVQDVSDIHACRPGRSSPCADSMAAGPQQHAGSWLVTHGMWWGRCGLPGSTCSRQKRRSLHVQKGHAHAGSIRYVHVLFHSTWWGGGGMAGRQQRQRRRQHT